MRKRKRERKRKRRDGEGSNRKRRSRPVDWPSTISPNRENDLKSNIFAIKREKEGWSKRKGAKRKKDKGEYE